MKQVYLDYNATTPVAPSVIEAMEPFLATHFGNPSSSHPMGRAAAEAIEDARARVAVLLGADSEEIVFTGGGTEANNLAIQGVMFAHGRTGHLVVSAIEHPAVLEPARFLKRLGYDVTIVPANGDGIVEPEAIRAAIRNDTVIVSVIHAQNEIGTIQPISEIARLCRSANVLVHTDASQSVGKIPTRCDELGVDLLTVAGHKLYAPKGVGALYIREGVTLEPLLHGGGQEHGRRSGTENTAMIVGLGQACRLADGCLDKTMTHMAELRDRLHERLQEDCEVALPINGCRSLRLPNTLSVRFPGVRGYEVLQRTPEVLASTGSACHSTELAVSAALATLGLNAGEAEETVRLSVGWSTSVEDIDHAASALATAYRALAID